MISPIVKLKDKKYHVVGELIVAQEITMAAAVTNLKRILAVCSDRKVFIISPRFFASSIWPAVAKPATARTGSSPTLRFLSILLKVAMGTVHLLASGQ